MGAGRDASNLLLLFIFTWTLSDVRCQVNCPPNADYRTGAGCYCREGYVRNALGTGCEDLNECATGEHQCQGTAVCVNLEATYRCDCAPGFKLYQTPRGFQCKDVDECNLNPTSRTCGANQKCENSPGSYRCNCQEGFSRAHAGQPCADIDECLLNAWACHNKANCSNSFGGYNCACRAGYRGDGNSCTDVDECVRLDICGVNAHCTNTDGSFRCKCVRLDGSTVDVTQGKTCEVMAIEERLEAGNETTHVGIGVGVAMAILALIVAIVIVVIVIRRRTPSSKSIPGLSLTDGVEITPMGLDAPHYENVPAHTDDNYITVIAEPDVTGNNFNDLYSNNKIVKSKNIYNENHSVSMDRRNVTPKVALKPKNYGTHDPKTKRKSYEAFSNQATVVTPGVRPSDYDTYNMLWEKINKDIETIKPALRHQNSKAPGVSRSVSMHSNYDHLRDQPDVMVRYAEVQDYNHLYDHSGQTSF